MDHPREVVEAALAHTVRNPVEPAYRRSDLFQRRRALMEDWARYLARETTTDAQRQGRGRASAPSRSKRILACRVTAGPVGALGRPQRRQRPRASPRRQVLPFRPAGARMRRLAPDTGKGQEPAYPMFHIGAGGGPRPLVRRSEFRCLGSSISMTLTMYKIDLLV